LTLGGETLAAASFHLTPDGAKTAKLFFSAKAPGRTDIRFDGALETGSAARLAGDLDLRAVDTARFLQWFVRGAPSLSSVAGAAPFRAFEVKGRVEMSRAGFLGRDLKIIADRSHLSGLVSLLRESAAVRPRLAVHLHSEELDIESLPDFSRSGAALNGVDLSLKLSARALRLARFGGGKVESGRISIDLQRDGERLQLNQLDIAGLGGADVWVKGEMLAGSSRIEGELRAQRLSEFSQLLQRVFPGAWSDALAARAVSLSPAHLRLSAAAAGPSSNLSLQALRSFSLQGEANGTRLEGSFKPGAAEAGGRFELSAANPQAHVIMQQAGLAATAMAGGAGRASLIMNGVDTQAGFSIDGASLSFKGTVKQMFPAPDIDGSIAAAGENITPFLTAIGLARAVAPPARDASIAAGIETRLRWRGDSISLSALRGHVAKARLAGDLSWTRGGGGIEHARMVQGRLQFDKLDLAALALLITGAPAASPSSVAETSGLNITWSRQAFAPALFNLPVARIEVNAGELTLNENFKGEGARFILQTASSQLALNDLRVKLSGGALTGRAELRRGGAEVSLSGAVSYEGAYGFGRAIAATGTWRLEFAGTGASPAALVSGLAGRGAGHVKTLTIEAASAKAVESTMARAQKEKLDVSVKSVAAHLEKALAQDKFVLKDARFSIALAGGQARVEPEREGARHPFSMQIDVRGMSVSARLDLRAIQTPADWKGPAPQVSLVFEGKPDAPMRRIEAASLVNALAARAIEREALRVELLEMDIRERALFNRYAKLQEFMTRREAELAAWRAEREREAAELQRKIEDEQRKAEAEAKRKEVEEARKLEAERKKREAEAARRGKVEAQTRPAAQTPTAPAPGAPLQLTPVAPR